MMKSGKALATLLICCLVCQAVLGDDTKDLESNKKKKHSDQHPGTKANRQHKTTIIEAKSTAHQKHHSDKPVTEKPVHVTHVTVKPPQDMSKHPETSKPHETTRFETAKPTEPTTKPTTEPTTHSTTNKPVVVPVSHSETPKPQETTKVETTQPSTHHESTVHSTTHHSVAPVHNATTTFHGSTTAHNSTPFIPMTHNETDYNSTHIPPVITEMPVDNKSHPKQYNSVCKGLQKTNISNGGNIFTIGVMDTGLFIITKNLYVFELPKSNLSKSQHELDLYDTYPVPLNLKWPVLYESRFKQIRPKISNSFTLMTRNEDLLVFITKSMPQGVNFDVKKNQVSEGWEFEEDGVFVSSNEPNIAYFFRKHNNGVQVTRFQLDHGKLAQIDTYKNICKYKKTVFVTSHACPKENAHMDVQHGYVHRNNFYLFGADSIYILSVDIYRKDETAGFVYETPYSEFFNCDDMDAASDSVFLGITITIVVVVLILVFIIYTQKDLISSSMSTMSTNRDISKQSAPVMENTQQPQLKVLEQKAPPPPPTEKSGFGNNSALNSQSSQPKPSQPSQSQPSQPPSSTEPKPMPSKQATMDSVPNSHQNFVQMAEMKPFFSFANENYVDVADKKITHVLESFLTDSGDPRIASKKAAQLMADSVSGDSSQIVQ